MELFAGKNIIVFGLGRSGLATVSWLIKQGAVVIVVDADPEKQKSALQLGAHINQENRIDWGNIAFVVQSPGIPLSNPLTNKARQHNIPIVSDCDLFRQANPEAMIVGVTGTNGKSTTTALIGHILNTAGYPSAIGGNIGIPVLSLPELGAGGIYVLELSSYQLELSHQLDINIIAWLNISEDHLERHETMNQYVQIKQKIFLNDKQTSKIVMGIDDPYSQKIYEKYKSQDITFPSITPVSCQKQLPEGLWIDRQHLHDIVDGKALLSADLSRYHSLPGIHNYQNIAIAYGVCRKLGLNHEEIFDGIGTFSGLEHRQELVKQIGKVIFVNDSKATNAEATAKALSIYNNVYWIAGGVSKKDGINTLQPYFTKISKAFLFGQAQEKFSATLGNEVPYQFCQTLEVAVRCAFQAANDDCKESIILFSPACASFDQFQDFEHRGRVFKDFVRQIKERSC